tara:strand:- start:306 stop:488 length:183 start_codon:yes stop_codon:yes gene_type:complete
MVVSNVMAVSRAGVESAVLFKDFVDLDVFILRQFLAVSPDDPSVRITALACTTRVIIPQA